MEGEPKRCLGSLFFLDLVDWIASYAEIRTMAIGDKSHMTA